MTQTIFPEAPNSNISNDGPADRTWRDWFRQVATYIVSTNVTSSTATAGAATLPSNPVGFFVVKVGNKNYKVPYYNV